MINFRTGRRPAVHTLRTMRSALAIFKALDPLGAPPAKCNDYVSAVMKQSPGGWGMYLNDQLGDCVIADSCHQVMLHTANAGKIVIPTDQDALAMYEAVGGYVPGNPSTDQGCDETAACQYLQSTGLCGQKSAGSATVDPTNLDHIRWTVQIFGSCRLGILVDESMEQLFSSKQPWENPAGADGEGHDAPVLDYDADYAYIGTWGGLQPVAWSLMANSTFLEEAHAEAFPDFISAGGTAPNGFNLAAMLADLAALKVGG